jgi:alpha-glucoside transport system permease protein
VTTVLEKSADAVEETAPDGPPKKPRFARFVKRSPLHLTVIVLCAIWLAPTLGLFVTSIRTPSDITSGGWWESVTNPKFTFFNYQQALEQSEISGSILNSLLIAVPTTVLLVLISAFAGYAFAWMRFPGRETLFFVVIAMLVVPPQVTLIPMLKLCNTLGLTGTLPAVWLYQIGFTLPFGIFMLRNFFAGLPKELIEAAQMDGASPVRTFMQVVLPVSAPACASLAILQFIWSWNDLLIPLLFLGGGSDNAPMTVRIAGLVQSTGEGKNLLTAATFIAVIIPLAVFFAMQRYFARGVVAGAVKG